MRFERFGWDGGDCQFKLFAEDESSGDWFGRRIAVSDDIKVIGVDDNGVGSTSAYVFSASPHQHAQPVVPRWTH